MVIDSGRVIAEGTPDELKRKVGGERLEVSVRADLVPAALAALVPVAVGPPMVSRAGDTVSAQLISGIDSIAEAAAALRAAGLDVTDFALRRPSLDDVFFQLTGAPTTKGGES